MLSVMKKHSDENASRPQWSSRLMNNQNSGYSGAERGDNLKNHHLLIDDDDYNGWGNINSNA